MFRMLILARLLWLLALFASLAEAQTPARIPRIGVLSGVSMQYAVPYLEAGREGLRELGYIEGRNIQGEFRFAGGTSAALPDLAADLVRLKVDLIVAVGDRAVDAAKHATNTIPIVMVSGGDPVRSGFVASLARPGSNITGLSSLLPEMNVKMLDLLKEIAPHASRMAVLWNPQSHGGTLGYEAMRAVVPRLGITLESHEVRAPDEIDRSFAAMTDHRTGAFIVLTDPLTFGQRRRVIDLAVKHRLPGMYEVREFANEGGLVSYGPSLSAMMRRSAVFIDKILKGAEPGDLPIEQPTKFELVINLKTAKALGLTIPQSLLLQADEVIQ
jgi:putative tryptophan/tyrosine transport system substrate-binding protein